jgi:hypothetical protein
MYKLAIVYMNVLGSQLVPQDLEAVPVIMNITTEMNS